MKMNEYMGKDIIYIYNIPKIQLKDPTYAD